MENPYNIRVIPISSCSWNGLTTVRQLPTPLIKHLKDNLFVPVCLSIHIGREITLKIMHLSYDQIVKVERSVL